MTRQVIDKMYYRPGMKTQVWRIPPELEDMFSSVIEMVGDPAVWLAGFAKDADAITVMAQEFACTYRPGGVLWLCYPKKSGGIPTDILRDNGWAPIHQLELLAVAQISVNHTWSALRFRYRYEIAKITRRSL